MKQFLFVCSVLLLASCGETKKNTNADGSPNGEVIYQQNCAICHGADGKLGAGGALDLSKSTIGLEERKQIITKGKGAMTPFESQLSRDQVHAVAVFIESLRK